MLFSYRNLYFIPHLYSMRYHLPLNDAARTSPAFCTHAYALPRTCTATYCHALLRTLTPQHAARTSAPLSAYHLRAHHYTLHTARAACRCCASCRLPPTLPICHRPSSPLSFVPHICAPTAQHSAPATRTPRTCTRFADDFVGVRVSYLPYTICWVCSHTCVLLLLPALRCLHATSHLLLPYMPHRGMPPLRTCRARTVPALRHLSPHLRRSFARTHALLRLSRYSARAHALQRSGSPLPERWTFYRLLHQMDLFGLLRHSLPRACAHAHCTRHTAHTTTLFYAHTHGRTRTTTCLADVGDGMDGRRRALHLLLATTRENNAASPRGTTPTVNGERNRRGRGGNLTLTFPLPTQA